MANLIKDQTPSHRSVLIPLQIRETNASSRTPRSATDSAALQTKTATPLKNDTSDLGKRRFFVCFVFSVHSSPSNAQIKNH